MTEERRHRHWLRDRRVEVYQQFLSEAARRKDLLWTWVEDIYYHGPEPYGDFLVPVYDLASDMELFGTPEAVTAARATLARLVEYMDSPRDEAQARSQAVETALTEYRRQIRADLRVQ